MAGLLDFLMTPESQLGIGLLAAASSGRSFGEGLLGATQSVAAQRRGLLQDKLLQSQVDENTSQAEMRKQQLAMAKRQMEIDNSLLGYGPQPIAGSMPQSAGGSPQMGGGGAPAQAGPTFSTPGGPMNLTQLSSKYGIPYEALAFDVVKNGGKKIAEMISEAAKPNWQNINGNLVNTNAPGFTGGFQPGMSISANGQATAWQPDGQGGLVVGAPRGALETFRAYQGAAADNKPIKVYNPATGREEYTSEGNVVRGARSGPDVPSPGYAGGSRDAAAPEQIRMMQNELMKLPQNHPDVPALQREIKRLQGSSSTGAQSGNYAAGPSATETAAAAAAQASAVDTAKADVVRDSDNRIKVRNATENLSNADRAIELLRLGPTGSAIGSMVDKGAAVFGRSTPGGNIAAQLDIVSANMVKNVPRFEGPQSNIDVEGYKAAAGRVADRSLPIDQRIAAAQEVKYFEQKAIRQAAGQQSGGASGSWDAAATQPAQQPRATMRFNPQTGRLEKVN